MKSNHPHTYDAYRTQFRRACMNGELIVVAKVLSMITKWKNIRYFFLPEEEGSEGDDADGTVLHCACMTNQIDIIILLLIKLRSLNFEDEEDQSRNLFQSVVLYQNTKNLTIWDVCCMFGHNTIKSILRYFCPCYCQSGRNDFQLLPKHSSIYLKGKLQRYYYQQASSSIGSKLVYWYYSWYFQQEFEWKSFYQEYQYIYWIKWVVEFLPRWPYYSFYYCLVYTFLWSIVFYWHDINFHVENTRVFWHALSVLCQIVLWFIIYKLYSQSLPTLSCHRDAFGTATSTSYSLEKYDTFLQAVVTLLYSIARNQSFLQHQHSSSRPLYPAITSLYLCHYCYRMKDICEEHSNHAQCCFPEYDHFCYFLWLDIAKHNHAYFIAYLLLIALAVIPCFFYCGTHYVQMVLLSHASGMPRITIGEEETKWMLEMNSFILLPFLGWLCFMWVMVVYLLVYQWILYRYEMTSQEWKTAAFRKEYAAFIPSRHALLTRLHEMR